MKIYVAHTYGRQHSVTDEQCEKNAERSIEWGRRLIKMGHNPFIPNLFHYVHKGWWDSPEEKVYFRLVSEWITDCDALFVAEMPPWEDSGVYKEIKIAKFCDMPVYYSIEDIPLANTTAR